MLPSSRSYFETFLGVMLAGGIPVPLYPPANEASFAEHIGHEAQRLNNGVQLFLLRKSASGRQIRSGATNFRRSRCSPYYNSRSQRGSCLAAPFPLASTNMPLIQYTSAITVLRR